MRRIESAKVLAVERTVMLSGAPGRSGRVSVTTIRSIAEFSSRSKAGPEKTPWVAQAITRAAPSSSIPRERLPALQASAPLP